MVVPLPQAQALALPQALAEAVALCEKVPQAVPLTVGVKLTLPRQRACRRSWRCCEGVPLAVRQTDKKKHHVFFC